MKKDKLHDIPKAFPMNIKVKKQTKEEKKQSAKELLDIMLSFGDISKVEYENELNKIILEIDEEFENGTQK